MVDWSKTCHMMKSFCQSREGSLGLNIPPIKWAGSPTLNYTFAPGLSRVKVARSQEEKSFFLNASDANNYGSQCYRMFLNLLEYP